MRKCLFVLSCFLFSYCTSDKEKIKQETEIIDMCFMSVLDTLAYKYHTLRPGITDSTFINTDSLTIAIFPKLVSIKKWTPSIKISLDTFQLKERFLGLLEKTNSDSMELPLEVQSIVNIGEYKIESAENIYARKIKGRIGSVIFSRVYYDEKVGFFISVIRDTIKNDVTKLFLIEKYQGKWSVIDEIVLEIS